jgi:hypothetical protein
MWIITAQHHISLEVTVKSFKKCSVVDGTDGVGCRVAVRGVSVKKMKALTVKMETETLIGKGK